MVQTSHMPRKLGKNCFSVFQIQPESLVDAYLTWLWIIETQFLKMINIDSVSDFNVSNCSAFIWASSTCRNKKAAALSLSLISVKSSVRKLLVNNDF